MSSIRITERRFKSGRIRLEAFYPSGEQVSWLSECFTSFTKQNAVTVYPSRWEWLTERKVRRERRHLLDMAQRFWLDRSVESVHSDAFPVTPQS